MNYKLYKNKEWLEEQYIVKKRSAIDMAQERNCSVRTIYNWLIKHNISVHFKGETCLMQVKHCSLTPELLEVINGELLGDACLQPSRCSAYLSWGQKYEEFVHYIKATLANFGINGGRIVACEKRFHGYGRLCKTYYFRAYSYEELLSLRKKWYPNNKKVVPEDIVLTPITCLHWYLGDGGLCNSEDGRSFIYLCAQGFPTEGVEFLAAQLNNLGFRTIKRQDNMLYIARDSAQNFLEYIGPCPVKCYEYKWNYRDNRKITSGISLSAPKKVLQYGLNGNFIAEYSSLYEASRLAKVYNIGLVCNEKRKTAGGFMWKFG